MLSCQFTHSLDLLHLYVFQKKMQTRPEELSLLVLSIVKDSKSWGTNRGFLDFLSLLANMTQQTPDLKLSLGLLASDMTTYLDLG